MTKVDRIPAPQRVTFDPESHALTINIGATCLQLVTFLFSAKKNFTRFPISPFRRYSTNQSIFDIFEKLIVSHPPPRVCSRYIL